ncbi:MAG: hypothetical protein M1821_000976 [Bathelium mastoideum]|nr:MAG: hypothetical protein M1821_000976 [Bathelium mastoideum]
MEKISLRDHDQEGNFRRRRVVGQRHNSLLNWLQWGVIVALQAIIITLLCVRPKAEMRNLLDTETGGDINGLYPTADHEYKRLKFEEDLYMPNMTSLDDRDEVRRRWDELLPRGSGSVAIPDYKKHPLLGEPIADDPVRTGPLFEASWTHALHCLYYSVDQYHQLVLKGPTGEENTHHASHCFEYLRTNLLCNLDMTLEGSYSANRESGGQAHVCRNRDQAVKWIEDRRVDDLQDIVGP